MAINSEVPLKVFERQLELLSRQSQVNLKLEDIIKL